MHTAFIEFIKNKDIPLFNFYYLIGEDNFVHQLVVKKLVNKYIKKDIEEFNYNAVEVDKNKQASELISLILSYPVFSDHRIVYIKNTNMLLKEASLSIVDNLKRMPKENIVIFSAENSLPKSELDAFLKKNGCIIKCSLSESELAEYIKIKLKKNNTEIKNDAIYHLISKVGSNLGLMNVELEKLIAHTKQGGHITKTDIDKMVTQNTFAKIYHLSDFIAKKDLKESISMVETLAREEGDEFIYTVLGYLNKHFKTLLSIKTMLENQTPANKISSALGIRQEYYFKNCLKQVGNFTTDELVKFFDYFQKADFNIKNSQDPVLTLELMLTSMCKIRS